MVPPWPCRSTQHRKQSISQVTQSRRNRTIRRKDLSKSIEVDRFPVRISSYQMYNGSCSSGDSDVCITSNQESFLVTSQINIQPLSDLWSVWRSFCTYSGAGRHLGRIFQPDNTENDQVHASNHTIPLSSETCWWTLTPSLPTLLTWEEERCIQWSWTYVPCSADLPVRARSQRLSAAHGSCRHGCTCAIVH
jgi:hypothetical protein